MTSQRVVRTAAATLTHTFIVDEQGVDSTTAVTVTVTDPNGSTVQTVPSATSAGQGVYTFALTPQAALTRLTVAWSATIAGAPITETDYVDVVGGRFFTLAQGRAAEPDVLGDATKYPTSALAAALLRTEAECEEICDRGFVPHYTRALLDGTGSTELVLSGSPDQPGSGHDIRTIRAVRIAPRIGQTYVPLTTSELAALAITSDGTLIRTDWNTWPDGRDTVIVEYEYGLDAPPADLVAATLTRFRTWATATKIGVPDRATSYTTRDGTTYRVDQPGPFKTGIPAVDAAYARYSLRDKTGGGDGRAIPASRPLNFDPQRFTLYHGGIR